MFPFVFCGHSSDSGKLTLLSVFLICFYIVSPSSHEWTQWPQKQKQNISILCQHVSVIHLSVRLFLQNHHVLLWPAINHSHKSFNVAFFFFWKKKESRFLLFSIIAGEENVKRWERLGNSCFLRHTSINACHSLEQEKSEYKGKTSREWADLVRVLTKFLLSKALSLEKRLDQENYQVCACVLVHSISMVEGKHVCNSWNLG